MDATALNPAAQPLEGLRVVEFTHMVMGPTCGMILGDLGAEVIKVEPIDGEGTRRLLGAGAGFFPMFNRNKKSVAADLHHPDGAAVARRLAVTADVVVENFKPGTMAKYDLEYASLSQANPRLVYVSNKGFLPGPYDHRTALDEVVQMMGGLAYMTGRPGDPLRAGTSVNDIMGGMFAAIATLGALIQRGVTGRGMEVQSALYENNVFLMGQHMLQFAVTGRHPQPMPGARQSLGDLRRVHRRRRRADLPGRGQRRAMVRVLRCARARGSESRSGVRHQQPAGGAATQASRAAS
jgi:crotonobetainyl-CoA:carnitine CoA-transferase CaiB-like acyl-CoA transferase